MRNLIQFLEKYHVAFIFVLLEVFCISILVTYNNYHNIRFFSITNEAAGSVNERVSAFTKYLSLAETNRDLASENAALRELIKESYLDTSRAFTPFIDTVHEQQFSYTAANVINSSVNKRRNYLMIDKGGKNGIERDMGVLSPSGVAGIVTEVSPNYATVMTLLHTEMNLSVRIKRLNYFGIVKWNAGSPDRVLLEDIPAHVKIVEGDTVVTRGAGGIFPPDQPVGTIESWEELPGSRFYTMKVIPVTNFRKIKHVSVIKNLHGDQIEELKNRISADND